jgi:hypothetical protein
MMINLPHEMEEALSRQAQQRQVGPEDIVREALQAYLQNGSANPPPANTPERDNPADDPSVYFARELATYERHRVELEHRNRGQFALLHQEKLVGVFKEWDDACSEGDRLFGLDKYMVYEIGDPAYEMFVGIQ